VTAFVLRDRRHFAYTVRDPGVFEGSPHARGCVVVETGRSIKECCSTRPKLPHLQKTVDRSESGGTRRVSPVQVKTTDANAPVTVPGGSYYLSLSTGRRLAGDSIGG